MYMKKGQDNMCIIAIKPSGVAMPTKGILRRCWTGNSDGAGIAYKRSGENRVSIAKGFMKIKTLLNALDTLNFGVEDEVIIHFRFATHGLADAGNCHPFPLSRSIKELRTVTGEFDTVIAHNGVFGTMPCHETLSDTQKFIGGIMCSPYIKEGINDPAIQELLSGYCGTSSKLAILGTKGLVLIGEFIKDNGIFYSNNGYKAWSYNKHNSYQDDDYTAWQSWKDEVKDGQCILCATDKDVVFSVMEDCFLCAKCIQFNLINN